MQGSHLCRCCGAASWLWLNHKPAGPSLLASKAQQACTHFSGRDPGPCQSPGRPPAPALQSHGPRRLQPASCLCAWPLQAMQLPRSVPKTPRKKQRLHSEGRSLQVQASSRKLCERGAHTIQLVYRHHLAKTAAGAFEILQCISTLAPMLQPATCFAGSVHLAPHSYLALPRHPAPASPPAHNWPCTHLGPPPSGHCATQCEAAQLQGPLAPASQCHRRVVSSCPPRPAGRGRAPERHHRRRQGPSAPPPDLHHVDPLLSSPHACHTKPCTRLLLNQGPAMLMEIKGSS